MFCIPSLSFLFYCSFFFFFFFNDPAPPEIYPLPLPDALPICAGSDDGARRSAGSPPPARARRLHVAWPWRVVFERLMGAHRIVVAEVGTQEPAKMGLTENHEVIQAVPVTNLIRERA